MFCIKQFNDVNYLCMQAQTCTQTPELLINWLYLMENQLFFLQKGLLLMNAVTQRYHLTARLDWGFKMNNTNQLTHSNTKVCRIYSAALSALCKRRQQEVSSSDGVNHRSVH